MKVIVTEPIAEVGIERLRQGAEVDLQYGLKREELLAIIDAYDALIVRSYTIVDEELLARGSRLKAVGRAGNGIDNIDLGSATRHGVVVINNPDGNSISAAEHTIGLLLAQSRYIPQATASLKNGKWTRKGFEGVELFRKTVGIIGFGRIGALVATRLLAFGMKVIAYDPYVALERFEQYGAERAETLAELLKVADFITIHTPKTEETYGMIGEEELKLVKPTVRVVNCARGGLINEAALYAALKEGRIASAALDVFDAEPNSDSPLFTLPNVTATAHMGATTVEAQDNVSDGVAQQVLSALKGEAVPNAVNLPSLPTQELQVLQPYIDLAEKLGKLYYQMHRDPVQEVEVSCLGELAEKDTKMITLAFLKGLLETVQKERVNYVNAPLLAAGRGMRVTESRNKDATGYPNLLRCRVVGAKGEAVYAGTVFGRDEQKIVEVMGNKVDVTPTPYMLIVENRDVPGMIGKVGTILGECQVNIASMQVGRQHVGSQAMMILNVDDVVGPDELARIRGAAGIVGARFIRL